jgi:hypothetical protein
MNEVKFGGHQSGATVPVFGARNLDYEPSWSNSARTISPCALTSTYLFEKPMAELVEVTHPTAANMSLS